MSIYILKSIILRSLKKTLNLQSYNGVRDTDEHVEKLDDQFDYHHVDEDVKWKLYVLTLIKSAMTIYKSLQEGIIDSWRDLYEAFINHFIS